MSLSTASRIAYPRRMARPAGSNFELWSWYFFRVSGVLMLVLVFATCSWSIINNVAMSSATSLSPIDGKPSAGACTTGCCCS